MVVLKVLALRGDRLCGIYLSIEHFIEVVAGACMLQTLEEERARLSTRWTEMAYVAKQPTPMLVAPTACPTIQGNHKQLEKQFQAILSSI